MTQAGLIGATRIIGWSRFCRFCFRSRNSGHVFLHYGTPCQPSREKEILCPFCRYAEATYCEVIPIVSSHVSTN